MENIINTYRNGKIYKIFNNIDNSCYVGSTIKELNIRMAEHITLYKLLLKYNINCVFIISYKLFASYGLEGCSIELIENYECLTKKEIYIREGYYINILYRVW